MNRKKPTTIVTPKVRCAVYTRKSTDEGLDQEFNSLDSQREACLAYITSQKAEGWMPVADRYDDPAYSGGTLNRPALQRLMGDIDAGKVDCVVTYKLDRFSRSLADFTRLMEVFEKRSVTFVSVTQSFNTTTSMGRLTLNILLSFAQFERETTADRIRDKYAASRQKGIWMGGIPPLGYDARNRELVVNAVEADQVRHIFRRFAECGSPTQVVKNLRASGISNKSWTTAEGICRKGQPIHKAALYRILKNPVYIGEVVYREVSYPGKHQPIVDRELWDRVHGLIAEHNRPNSTLPRGQTPFPLKGLVRCGHCDVAMKPTHSSKNGQVQYRYYICINAARTSHDQCALPSVPAAELERLVLNRVRGLLKSPEVVARAIHKVRKADPEMDEREIVGLLSCLDPIWEELFPLEQNRLLKLLVDKLVVSAGGIDLRLRVAGLGALVDELTSTQERNMA
ncbi:MAG: recombinase family protein [Magnetococcales bacterium]|nr:recombinase family protein [Magnetococcales bacterium]